MKRNIYVGATFLALLIALGVGVFLLQKRASVEAATVQAPMFEVDPLWPKPMPNHWLIGMTIGVSVDAQDNIWIVHRQGSLEPGELHAATNPPMAMCCIAAPPVLEFDQAGNLLHHWGGPGNGYDWPDSNHGITVDYKGNVWIGGNGRGKAAARPAGGAPDESAASATASYLDNQVLKFTQDGQFLMQIGKPSHSKGSNDLENLRLPAKTFIDKETNEVYVADGYGNHRVAVIDMGTGKIKRYWGAYGNKPDDEPLGPYDPNAPPAQQFRNPVHCAEMSTDGFVYVCDRPNDRIQVFTREGKFVKEVIVEKNTRGDGSTWDIAFSRDPQQKYFFLADGANEKIHVFDRASLTELTSFGDGGRQPGQFYAVHSIATDSKGNLYTTETYEGKRVQKFVYKGIGAVPKAQGTVWPTRTSSQ